MKYLSVCSGIEAASVAWHPLGWEPVAFSEIEKFPSAVLAHHYPNVPNLGDMTKFHEWPDFRINLLVGGTPCQAFSVAGLREGLADPRGNLTLTFLGVAAKYRPEWVVWENVPGVLSSTNGQPESQPPDRVGVVDGEAVVVTQEYEEDQAFAAFLAGLAELGYGCAYRIFDAQYFGVAQRRRRVFVVGCLGDGQRAAQVLFEPEGMSGNPPPSRQARKDLAPTLAARTKGGGGLGTDFDCDGGCIPIQEPGKRTGRSTIDSGCGIGIGKDGDPMFTMQAGAVHGVAHALIGPTLNASGAGTARGSLQANETDFMIAHILKAEGLDASEDGAGRGTPLVPVKWPAEIAPTLNASFGDKQGLEDQHALNGGGYLSPAKCLTTKNQRNDFETENLIAVSMPPPIAFNWNAQPDQMNFSNDTVPTLTQSQGPAIGFQDDTTPKASIERIGAIRANAGGEGACVQIKMAVRRLTPVECERLQGFPDHYTQIPFRGKPSTNCPDGPRYKALGNSMAVPCMAWIGRRIASVAAQPLCLDE